MSPTSRACSWIERVRSYRKRNRPISVPRSGFRPLARSSSSTSRPRLIDSPNPKLKRSRCQSGPASPVSETRLPRTLARVTLERLIE